MTITPMPIPMPILTTSGGGGGDITNLSLEWKIFLTFFLIALFSSLLLIILPLAIEDFKDGEIFDGIACGLLSFIAIAVMIFFIILIWGA